MMAAASVRVAIVQSIFLLAPVAGNVFLGGHSVKMQAMKAAEVRQALISELALASSTQIQVLKDDLQPLYESVQKNSYGNAEPSVVRYMLHRYFADRHGWHLEGVATAGEAWNASAPTTIMKDQIPSYIQEMFEERMHGHGLDLEGLAVFVATIYDLIHRETVGDFDVLSTVVNISSLQSDPEEILKLYLAAKINGIDGNRITLSEFRRSVEDLKRTFPQWDDTVSSAVDAFYTLRHSRKYRLNPFKSEDFTDLQVQDQFLNVVYSHSSWHHMECRIRKDMLLSMEHKGTGRVPLSTFYSSKHDRLSPFTEKKEYLRTIGALDETDPSRPSVMIPNYLYSHANCLTTSSFYSLCCRDECEGLMSHIERTLAKPSATPAEVEEVVSQLSSETVQAPRNLTFVQSTRLSEIAQHHSGAVPLHGRLFAQWLHHVYPRECPFPHLSGTTSAMSEEDWAWDNGGKAHINTDEMILHAKEMMSDNIAEALPWTAVEELVSAHHPRQGRRWSSLGPIVVLAAIAYAVVSTLSGSPSGFAEGKGKILQV